MLGFVVDEIARLAAALRPHRTIVAHETPVKVNVGAGLSVAPGWINLDGSIHALAAGAPRGVLRTLYRFSSTMHWLPQSEYVRRLSEHRYVHVDLERPLPFRDGTVDYVYSSHVLEHLFLDRARHLVGEMFRILKPGGVIRLCVPDLRHAVGLYQAGDRRAALEFFFTEAKAPYFRQHRYMYDFELLSDMLTSHGFRAPQQCEYQRGQCPDAAILDAYPDETLFVEATK